MAGQKYFLQRFSGSTVRSPIEVARRCSPTDVASTELGLTIQGCTHGPWHVWETRTDPDIPTSAVNAIGGMCGMAPAPGNTCKCDHMTTAVDDLVSLFAAKLRMDGTRVSPVTQGSREVLLEYQGDGLTLVLPEDVLSALLAEGDELARNLWGPSVSAQEAAARLMTVHLQESLDSSGREDLSGTWTYRSSGFFFKS